MLENPAVDENQFVAMYYKINWLVFCLFLSTPPMYGQLATTHVSSNNIPKEITYKGHIVDAIKWHDTQGDHIVITSETGKTSSKNDPDAINQAIYAYHYLMHGNEPELLWKVYDFMNDCPLDIRARFVKNTFQVTDLDKNGKAEVWMMYQITCRGDVSPATMKIIMYEGMQKHAMRGENRVAPAANEHVGGQYTFDAAFKASPAVFRQFASELWQKNIDEKWDD